MVVVVSLNRRPPPPADEGTPARAGVLLVRGHGDAPGGEPSILTLIHSSDDHYVVHRLCRPAEIHPHPGPRRLFFTNVKGKKKPFNIVCFTVLHQ